MNHVWGLFAHPNREMSVIKSENETISHHYTHHVLLMAAVPVVCAFIGTTQLGWNFGDGTVIKLSMLTGLALAVLFYAVMLAGVGNISRNAKNQSLRLFWRKRSTSGKYNGR